MKQRMLCWFSCGAASAVATKLAIGQYSDVYEVIPVCCDTRPSENSDNYRFSLECEKWFGRPIVFISNDQYKDVDEVFEKTGYMSGPKGARCTVELKKKPRFKFAKADDIHVFGFTSDEKKRIVDFQQRNPELFLKWILSDMGISKTDCYKILEFGGIKRPVNYELGFDNNNCPGCVKATSPWYWDMVRFRYPTVFVKRCEQSRKLGVHLVRVDGKRVFLDQLPYGPFKKPAKKEKLSCGPECGVTKV